MIAKAPDIDPEGYLVDPAEWTEKIAEEIAKKEGITLTEEHWAIIHFMRDYWEEHQIAPDVRWTTKFVTETMGADRNRLFELFPYGYPQQACRVAGMKRPRAWSTG
ncbi:MAG: TusE/DsrC/DsvC family sulfur relay protein [Planctomycetes bacterium]|nr:TusE/DsrC/DsvC family sulfur relay protein [Planctomycetota bacterium]